MKSLKKIVMVLMVLSMIVAFATPASAVQKWHSVNVLSSTTSDTGAVEIYIEKSGKFRTFTVPVGQENKMLAMALCAQSAGMQLSIFVDFALNGSEIGGMSLVSPAQ